MFINFNSIILLILGGIFLFFAKSITNGMFRLYPHHRFSDPKFRNLLYILPIRFMGVILFIFGFWISTTGPSRSIMDKDENRIALLENGKITKGEVSKRFYQNLATAGWKIIYKFDAEAATTSGERIYWGSAQGPWKYYISLNKDDPVTIIYDANNPKVNCEIRYFLNNPNYRHTFQKTGKLELLDKFKNEYELEDYSFNEWYDLQQRK